MVKADFIVNGDTAIVTAAGRGIGYEIADQLSQSGIDIIINDLDSDRLTETQESLTSNKGTIHTVAGDTSKTSTSKEIVSTAVDHFDGIDILVNNVGIAGPTKPCEQLTKDEFMNILNVNIGGIFNPTSAAIPYLKESNAGRVVNLSSMTAKNPLVNRSPYSTAKMGIIGFTRVLALELAKNNVTVNAICPGSVWGERLKGTYEQRAEVTGQTIGEIKDESLRDSPLGSFVEAEDIADTVLYLCSQRAKKITGQDLNVTSGKVMY